MDLFTREDLRRLAETSDQPALSLYMPTYRAGREVRQNATRFSNLLKSAEQKVADAGEDAKALRPALEEAAKLASDGSWWQHQADGLAMFLTAKRRDAFRVPLEFPELVTVARRFHVRPMVPLLQGDGRFYVLAVSQNQVRLLEGTQHSVAELEPEQLPKNLRSALNIDEYTTSVQQHATSGTDVRGRDVPGNMIFHGHGAADMDVHKKDEIQRYFHHIDNALEQFFHEDRVPLVFAGVDYLFPLFRETCSYKALLDRAVTGNPDELSVAQLHQQAWKVVEPTFDRDRQAAAQRYDDTAASDRASSDLKQVVKAARQGAVDTLLLDSTQQRWGIVDEQSPAVVDAEQGAPGAEELLNYAAVHTIANSGTVYALAPEQMPGGNAVAALLRHPVT